MSYFKIGNINNPPLNGVNGSLVNTDSSSVGGIPLTSNKIPCGPHTIASPYNNVMSAASKFPFFKGGGKINRNKINKISRKYKMKCSRRTNKHRFNCMKSRMRSKYAKRYSRRHNRSKHFKRNNRSRYMKGGAFQSAMATPNYPNGHNQYLNNDGSLSNTYSRGGPLSATDSALANPAPYQLVKNASVPDNLNHNTLNANGNIGAGSGFPSRGWF
jgi:hypothetical protein